MNEIWKDVIGYEGLYQVSDLGRVKSLEKKRLMPNGNIRVDSERILKPGETTKGYLQVVFYNKTGRKHLNVHRLVFETFNGKTDLQIDHIIEGNKKDNRLCNLQSITNRENSSKHRLTKEKSSKYTGVHFDKRVDKWVSTIRINGKTKYLGQFMSEIDASGAYQKALAKLSENGLSLDKPK